MKEKLIKHYQYLIVGGGMTGDAAVRGIRELDAAGSIADWQGPFKKGVVHYLQGGIVRGVLLWNVWDAMPAARALLAEPGSFKIAELLGQLALG